MSDPLLYLGEHKRCSKCGKYKDMATKYNKNRSRCKDCERSARRKFRDRSDWFWKFFWSHIARQDDCLVWIDNKKGTPSCRWQGTQTTVRRVVYQLSCGDIPENMSVLVTCKNRRCVNRYHMYLGTREDCLVLLSNSSPTGKQNGSYTCPDCRPRGDRHGARLHPEKFKGMRGDQHPRARLDTEKVKTIRVLRREGMTQAVIALQMDVSIGAINNVLRGKTWKHVQ